VKYFVKGRWYTELGRRIVMNDLLNDMQVCMADLKKCTISDMVKTAMKHGATVRINFVPNKQKGTK